MNNIELKPIDEDNFNAVIDLDDTLSDAQKRCVAPNVYSLAEAYVHGDAAWPRAIVLEGKPIGFVMLSRKEEGVEASHRPAYALWRLMIASPHQGKGYGASTLDLLVDKCRDGGIKTLYTSCNTDGEQPYRFYIDYGFIDTKKMIDDEQLLMLAIP